MGLRDTHRETLQLRRHPVECLARLRRELGTLPAVHAAGERVELRLDRFLELVRKARAGAAVGRLDDDLRELGRSGAASREAIVDGGREGAAFVGEG